MRIKQGFMVAAMSACLSNAVFAAEAGGYMGVGLGYSAAYIKNTATGLASIHTSSSAQLLGGYKLNNNFAVEAVYVDLGEFVDPVASIKAAGWGVSGVAILPMAILPTMDKLSLYGKLGVTRINTTSKAGTGYVLLGESSESKTGVSYGVGGEYEFTPNTALRMSLDSYEYSALSGSVTGRFAVAAVTGLFKF